MIKAKIFFSLIAFLPIILFSTTADVFCEELPSPMADTQQKKMQTPKTQGESTSPGMQQEKVQEHAPDQANAPSSSAEKLKQAGEMADDIHVKISKQVADSALWFDSFFANERFRAEENHSNIRLGFNFLLEDSFGLSVEPRLSGRVVLPKLEKKYHLIFSVDPEEPLSRVKTFTEDTNNQQVITDTPQTTVSAQRRYATALQYFLKSTEDLSISIRSGLQFSGVEPVVFAAPRYRQLIPLGLWNFRFTQEVMFRTDAKWQETTRFDFERSLYSLFFRFTAEGAWFQDTAGYFYSFSFVLSQPLGLHNGINYEWINSFQTEPTGKLTDSVVKVHYRQNIWHDWIFLDITPDCRFPSVRGYRFTPGIFLGLEAVFGKPD
jgi:hypothetical protein